MIRFVVIATLNRGAVEPHEALDDAGQWLANRQAEIADANDETALRRRATLGYQWERDPLLSEAETLKMRTRVREEACLSAERMDRMMSLAARSRIA